MPTRPADPLDDEIRGLYQGPLGEFTPARQSLLKRLQKAHDPRATEIKELRKPTPSAWAVNLLFAHEPKAMAALIATGARAHAAVERALAKSDGTEVRAALETLRTEGARLAERAVELLSTGGAAPSATVVERLRGNIDALVLDPAQTERAARGWLDVDLDAPGFDVLAALQLAAEKGRGRPEPSPSRPAVAATPPGKTAAPAKAASETKAGKAEQARRAREDQDREQRIAAARAELERLEAAAEARRKAADSSAAAAVEATAKAAEAASSAELARRAAHDARRAADAAGAEVVRAREAVRRAENS